MPLEIKALENFIKIKENERIVERIVDVRTADDVVIGKNANFLSDISRVTVTVQLRNGDTELRSYIVKKLPKSDRHAAFVEETRAFVKEIQIYDRILKFMDHHLDVCCDREDKLWCEMLGFEPFHTIVLEDLRAAGYQTINIKNGLLDFTTTQFMVASLGRFHALTVAARNSGVFNSDEFTDYFFTNEHFVRCQMTYSLKTASEAMASSWGPKWKDAAERIKKLSGGSLFETLSRLRKFDEKFGVLNHGDFWPGNFLLKFDRFKKIIATKYVDFQLVHFNSFAWDLTHALYCSAEPSVRRRNFNFLLDTYLTSLNEHLTLYGVESAIPLTIDDVAAEMNRLRPFAMIIQFLIVAFVTCDLDNVIDKDEFFFSSDDDHEPSGLNPEIFTCDKFRNQIEEDLEQFLADGVL